MVDGKMQDLLKQTFALKPRHGQQMTIGLEMERKTQPKHFLRLA